MVAPGQQVSDLEIRLQEEAVYSIKGTVIGLETVTLRSDGSWPPDMRQTYASARPKGSSDQLGGATSAPMAKNGSFEIPNLPSGAYELTVLRASAYAILARTVVDVNANNVSSISLQVVPPQSLNGKIEIDGGNEIDLSNTWISGEDDRGNMTTSTRVKPDRSFTLANLSPGQYTLHVWRKPRQMYLKAVMVRGVESPGGKVDLTSGNPPPITVVLSRHGASLQGLVKSETASGATHSLWKIVLVPDSTDPAALQNHTQTASVDQNGAFTLQAIAPGKYKLYAFEKIANDLWENPDLLKELEPEAQTISLTADQSTQVTPRLIPSPKTEQILASLGIP